VPLASELPRALLSRSYQTGFRKGGYLLRSARLCPENRPTVFGTVAQVCTPSFAETRALRLSDIIQSEERKLHRIPYGERQLYEHGWY
jgi:hypothetical protein